MHLAGYGWLRQILCLSLACAIVSAQTPAPAPAAAPVTVVVAAPPAPAATASSETDARIAALSAHVEELQKALADATQQLNEVNAKLAAGQNAQPQQSTLAIEERINGIEQKMMQMEQHKAKPSVTIATINAVAPAPRRTHVTHRQTPVSHRTVKAVHWVLRAASPDEAWVAKDIYTSDLQPVEVGDSLAGIGKVTAIREENGAWMIEGTQGEIR